MSEAEAEDYLIADNAPAVERFQGWTQQQRQVDHAIAAVGGYWEPQAAVLRLHEELGELAEALQGDTGDLGEELADLMVISTCLANQFQIGLAEPDIHIHPQPFGREAELGALVSATGRIARIINYYAGPKTPRRPDLLEHLTLPILELHRDLYSIARTRGVDLDHEVELKTDRTVIRDAGRFNKSFDPNKATVLDEFRTTVLSTACPFARAAKLWGGPTWLADRSIAYNCLDVVPHLRMFARAASREGLDAFVVRPVTSKPLKVVSDVARLLREIVHALTRFDPVGGGRATEVVEMPGWQFSFAGQRMFLTVFSDVYPVDHVRYSQGGTFLVFQPEESFTSHGVGGGQPNSERIKEKVRTAFARRGQKYPSTEIDARVEAALYLLPAHGRTPVKWWDSAYDDTKQLVLF